MILLLDAHAVLWWLADDPALDPVARSAIADPTNDVLVSAASIWEIEIKRALGKLVAPAGLVRTIDAAGFDVLPITGQDAETAGSSPRITATRSTGCSSRRRIASVRSWSAAIRHSWPTGRTC